MYLFNSVGFTEVFGTYLFAIDAADFWFGMFCAALLGVGSVILAMRPQPVPHWTPEQREAMHRHPSGRT